MLEVERIERDLCCELIQFKHFHNGSYVCLPLTYPSGSHVSVSIVAGHDGNFNVSDGGFSWTEAEQAGLEDEFAAAAARIAEREGISSNGRCLYALATREQLAGTIGIVAAAARDLVADVYCKLDEAQPART